MSDKYDNEETEEEEDEGPFLASPAQLFLVLTLLEKAADELDGFRDDELTDEVEHALGLEELISVLHVLKEKRENDVVHQEDEA